MLPELKTFILLPVDREYQTLLESAIADLLMDRHPECLNRVRQSVKLMDKISYRMQSVCYSHVHVHVHVYTLYTCILYSYYTL